MRVFVFGRSWKFSLCSKGRDVDCHLQTRILHNDYMVIENMCVVLRVMIKENLLSVYTSISIDTACLM